MLRVVLVSVVISGCVATLIRGDEPKSKGQTPATSPRLVPDRTYRPSIGDQVVIVEDNCPCAVSWAALDDYTLFRKANDSVGAKGEIEAKRVFGMPLGTKLLLIEDHTPKRKGGFVAGGASGMYRNLQNAAVAPKVDYPVEVRILEGEHAGELGFISNQHVGRLIPDPTEVAMPKAVARKKAKEHKPSPEPKAVSVDAQSANALQLGKNLRYDGNRDAAIEYFRKAIALAPESKAATEAKAILKEMGIK